MINLDFINFATNSEEHEIQKNTISYDNPYREGIQKMKTVMDSPFFPKDGVHLTYDLNSEDRDHYDEDEFDSGQEDETTEEDSDHLADEVIPLDNNIQHAAFLASPKIVKNMNSPESDGLFSDDYNDAYLSSHELIVDSLNLDLRTDMGVFPVYVGI